MLAGDLKQLLQHFLGKPIFCGYGQVAFERPLVKPRANANVLGLTDNGPFHKEFITKFAGVLDVIGEVDIALKHGFVKTDRLAVDK